MTEDTPVYEDQEAKQIAASVDHALRPKRPSLMQQIESRGIDPGQWHTLCNSLYPGAAPQSVLLVIDYCKARGRDPLKKPCHIVPMEVKDAVTGQKAWRDVIMPGIYEYRMTAQETGEYLGQARPEYGQQIDYKGVAAPEFCELTVYRWNEKAQMRGEYTVITYFSEVVAETWDKKRGQRVPNGRWSKAPRQMLTKCAEAAALRMAFPDELGGEMTVDEVRDSHGADFGVKDVEAPSETQSKVDEFKKAIQGQLMESNDE